MKLHTPLPDFAGVTEWVNGQVDKEQLEGHSVLVHFWAVSCQLCKDALFFVNHWRDVYGEPYKLKFIGVHSPRSDQDAELAPIMAAIHKYELTHPIIMDRGDAMKNAFQNGCVPAYYLFDERHQLRHYHAADRGLRLLDQRIQKIVGVER